MRLESATVAELRHSDLSRDYNRPLLSENCQGAAQCSNINTSDRTGSRLDGTT